VIRAAGVDETYTADGDTAVSGHGTPEAGTVVIGTDHVVLSGAAVVPAGTSTAAVAPDPVESVDETVEGDEDDVETDRGEEDGEADDGEGDDEDGSDEDGSDETAEAADESAESDRADSDDPDARPGISIDGAGVSGGRGRPGRGRGAGSPPHTD